MQIIALFLVSQLAAVSRAVRCGGHEATECKDCPQGNSYVWCNGDCQWEEGACVPRETQCENNDVLLQGVRNWGDYYCTYYDGYCSSYEDIMRKYCSKFCNFCVAEGQPCQGSVLGACLTGLTCVKADDISTKCVANEDKLCTCERVPCSDIGLGKACPACWGRQDKTCAASDNHSGVCENAGNKRVCVQAAKGKPCQGSTLLTCSTGLTCVKADDKSTTCVAGESNPCTCEEVAEGQPCQGVTLFTCSTGLTCVKHDDKSTICVAGEGNSCTCEKVPCGDFAFGDVCPACEGRPLKTCVASDDKNGVCEIDSTGEHKCVPGPCSPEFEWSYDGNNLEGGIEKKNWIQCAILCDARSDCFFWTWVDSRQRCYVKSSDSGRTHRTEHVSGPKCTLRPCSPMYEWSYDGNDLEDGIKKDNWMQCATLCEQRSDCFFWTWVDSRQRCYVKSSDSGGMRRTKHVSGSKCTLLRTCQEYKDSNSNVVCNAGKKDKRDLSEACSSKETCENQDACCESVTTCQEYKDSNRNVVCNAGKKDKRDLSEACSSKETCENQDACCESVTTCQEYKDFNSNVVCNAGKKDKRDLSEVCISKETCENQDACCESVTTCQEYKDFNSHFVCNATEGLKEKVNLNVACTSQDTCENQRTCCEPSEFCPASNPYAYLQGNYCCKHNKEKHHQPDGSLCDKSEIAMDSTCCYNDEHVPCPNPPCHTRTDACPDGEFACLSDRACLPDYWKCDGEEDCVDSSDEMHCTCSDDQFICQSNGVCIPGNWKCDSWEDCADSSDEMHCTTTTTAGATAATTTTTTTTTTATTATTTTTTSTTTTTATTGHATKQNTTTITTMVASSSTETPKDKPYSSARVSTAARPVVMLLAVTTYHLM